MKVNLYDTPYSQFQPLTEPYDNSEPEPTMPPPPLPTLTEPVPTLSEPLPTLSEPVPTLSEPLPTLSEPLPTLSEPLPTLSEPLPTISEPLPTITSPVPTLSQPTPTEASVSEPSPTRSASPSPTRNRHRDEETHRHRRHRGHHLDESGIFYDFIPDLIPVVPQQPVATEKSSDDIFKNMKSYLPYILLFLVTVFFFLFMNKKY